MLSSLRIGLPSPRLLLPNRIRRRWRSAKSRIHSRQSPTSAALTSIETSYHPADTIRALRKHRWSKYDAQYLLLAFIGIFALSAVQEPGPLIKLAIATVLLGSLVLPVTRQFFLPFLPIIGWLVLFYACKYIPAEYRPPIWVRVLPSLETIFYGANLSNILSAQKHVVLDLLGWFPYGILHYGGPAIFSIIMFIFGPPGFINLFAITFGYMNIVGVVIQILFPCSAPWYENLYGLAPANYSIHGSPAGLAAIDKLFHIDLYTSGFTASPLVFGAFPSLHAGNSVLEALFMSQLFPKLRPLIVCYPLWMCWATMYLSHHYAVDLVAGGLLAGIAFFITYTYFLPRVQLDKSLRWDYDYVEFGQPSASNLFNTSDYSALLSDRIHSADSDEWTLGSSSSIAGSSRARSPSSPKGSLSRSSSDGHGVWDGDTLGSGSDGEVVR
ncbi:PAP2-domain-containing protein [Eremomyces bilateralis CBS 781.70]|uniref:PAP2-domain-containing protein n=1 Tax=Eremomyces bilateralis CBS 781.70 TaxID=1392243 RepID=A0A6G1FTW0_9PEZI|nr:PAP2-domain-containing protein [Eremomyces bilateralis CBS 781.70]KAF1809325.1 PAP2-domain-containing protein [Eremomyces bilateralis CBS 781.70]